MLPPDCRLPFLVSRFLQLKHLNLKPTPLPFEVENNPLLGVTLAEDDPCTIPFVAEFSGNSISDGFYTIQVYLDPSLEIPQKCLISIMHWTLDFENSAPTLTIIKASVVATIYSLSKTALVPIENNPRVAELMQKLRHQRISLRYDIYPIEDTYEERKPQINDSLMSDAPDSFPQYNIGNTPLKENKPISLGVGSRGKEKSAELKSKREVVPISSQEDLMTSLMPSFREEVLNQDYQEEELLRDLKEERGFEINQIEIDQEVGIEEFPSWALDYLKFFYKVA